MRTRVEDRDDDLRPEYDFSAMKGGVRGKYAKQYRQGTNVVLLDPDVARVFRDSQSVNEALRGRVGIARTRVPKRRPKSNKPLQPTA